MERDANYWRGWNVDGIYLSISCNCIRQRDALPCNADAIHLCECERTTVYFGST